MAAHRTWARPPRSSGTATVRRTTATDSVISPHIIRDMRIMSDHDSVAVAGSLPRRIEEHLRRMAGYCLGMLAGSATAWRRIAAPLQAGSSGQAAEPAPAMKRLQRETGG